MADKEYVCGYKHCLHHGQKVLGSESVIISNKHFHMDCANMRQQIKECVDTYMEYKEDKTVCPMATKIINNLVFKDRVPVEYVLQKIRTSKLFYTQKPVNALYGIRRLFWEYDCGR